MVFKIENDCFYKNIWIIINLQIGNNIYQRSTSQTRSNSTPKSPVPQSPSFKQQYQQPLHQEHIIPITKSFKSSTPVLSGGVKTIQSPQPQYTASLSPSIQSNNSANSPRGWSHVTSPTPSSNQSTGFGYNLPQQQQLQQQQYYQQQQQLQQQLPSSYQNQSYNQQVRF